MGFNMYGGYNQPQFQPPRKTEVITVKGENGANAFPMLPDSKAIFVDETAPLIWFAETDGAGYKTLFPFTISPYEPAKPVDMNEILERLTRLEAKVNAESNVAKSNNAENATE